MEDDDDDDVKSIELPVLNPHVLMDDWMEG